MSGRRFAGEVDELREGAANLEVRLAGGVGGVPAPETYIHGDVADHINVMWQTDIFVFPVYMLASRPIPRTHLVVHNEGALHIDLDRRWVGRGPGRSSWSITVCDGKGVLGIVVGHDLFEGLHRGRLE